MRVPALRRLACLLSVLAVSTLLAPGQARAEDRFNLPIIEPETDLRPLETADDVRGWEAIGRLDMGNGFCTATLIAPDLVLTAAHCLFDGTPSVRRNEADLSFNAGLRHGRATATRGVRQSVVHPDYVFGEPESLDRVRTDLALLVLDRSIPEQSIRPIATRGAVTVGDTVSVVSYGEDREEFASLENDCEVLAQEDGVLVLSCSVVHGSSGSPIMVSRDGQIQVVSVVSALAQWQDDQVALSAELDGSLAELLDLIDRRNQQVVRSLPQVRTLGVEDDGRESSGARFLRP